MALTLTDYLSNPKQLVAGVSKALMEESPFFASCPIESVGALSIEVVREGGLPTIAWRKIGASHSSNKATKPQLVKETAFSFGNTIDIDKAYIKDGSPRLYDPRVYQLGQTTKAMAREFNDAVINGNPVSDEDRPTGLWYRIKNDFSGQKMDAASGSGLDISPDATGLAANIQTFFDKLDKLLYACADHKADVLLMNDTMLQRYWSIARQSGLLKTTSDNLGREFYEYKGAKVIDMGYKINDSTKIILDTELTNGTAVTGGAATSIYAVRFGKENFTAWEEYPMDVQEKGELEDGVTYRTVIDWIIGLAVTHPRSIAQLYGVIAA
jgi:hypothetical protein